MPEEKEQVQDNEQKEEETEQSSTESGLNLAKIEKGADHTAIITASLTDNKDESKKIELAFTVNMPTVQEDMQISLREQEIKGQNVDNIFLTTAIRMIATLDIVVKKIVITDDEQKITVVNGTFWTLTQSIKQVGKFYKEVVFPVYQQFIDFQQEVELDFDALKKALAHLGSK